MDFKLHYLGNHIIEKTPFQIDRPEGSYRYIFFHFISAVKILDNNQLVDAPPGSCILYTPGQPQKIIAMNTRLNHDYLDFTILDSNLFKEIRFPVNKVLTPWLNEYISETIKSINQEKMSSIIGSEYIINSLMSDLFVNISRKVHHFSMNNFKYREDLKFKFEELRLLIYTDPGTFKISKMAEELDFSRSHFNLLYKDFFNVTPIEDLTYARIEKVKTLLLTEDSMDQVANKLGFNSIEYFFRWFKKNLNCTPTAYKIEIQQEQENK